MKQEITKKQWNELTMNEKRIFDRITSNIRLKTGELTIGQMIEFLGDDFNSIGKKMTGGGLQTYVMLDCTKDFWGYELCDVLWEAVKHKINDF